MRFVLTCLVVMLCASPALAFEGLLEASLSSDKGVAANIRAHYSKAGDVRMDVKSKDAAGQAVFTSTIMPAKGERFFSIMHDQRVIVETPYSKLAETSQQVTGSGESANLEIKKLGKETVSGIATRHVQVIDKDNDAVIDLWLTEKYPADLWTRAFRGRNLGLEMSDDERSKAMKKYGVKPGFSMKMRVEQAGGVPVVFLVKKIERQAVPSEIFSLPDGYRRVEAPTEPQP
jgi:hypothetical protein